MTSSDDYWLCRCEGFEVTAADGLIGLVEHVRFRSRIDRPDAIAVRIGTFGRHLVVVPVEEVLEVFPDEERLVVQPALGGVRARPSSPLLERMLDRARARRPATPPVESRPAA